MTVSDIDPRKDANMETENNSRHLFLSASRNQAVQISKKETTKNISPPPLLGPLKTKHAAGFYGQPHYTIKEYRNAI
jgi:hypothetical protein